MRIVVTSDYLSTKPRIQGYQSQQLNLARAFLEMGHEVLILSGKRKDLDIAAFHNGLPGLNVKILPSLEPLGLKRLFQMYIPGIIKEIKRFNPDLVICNELHSPQSLRINLRIARKVPTVLIQGRFGKSSHLMVNALLSSYTLLYRFCGLHMSIACKTHTSANYIYQLLKVSTGVLPVGVSDIFKPLPIEVDYDFIFVGAFSEIKQPLMFVNVIGLCVSLGWEGKAIMVGQGKLTDSVNKMIKDMKLIDYIEVVDYVPNECMPSLYNRSRILVSFSKTEIFGMVYLEALACGCYVFCTKTAGSTDLSKTFEEIGLIVDTDHSVLARQLFDLLGTAVRVNPQKLELYRWSNIANRLIELGNEHT